MARFRLKSGKYHGTKNGQHHTYRPGDVIELKPDKVRHMMDILEPLEPIETVEEETAAPREQLVVVHKGGGKYNVINTATGEPINDILLTKRQAEALANGEKKESEAEGQKDDRADGTEADSKDMAKSDSVSSRRRSQSK